MTESDSEMEVIGGVDLSESGTENDEDDSEHQTATASESEDASPRT